MGGTGGCDGNPRTITDYNAREERNGAQKDFERLPILVVTWEVAPVSRNHSAELPPSDADSQWC